MVCPAITSELEGAKAKGEDGNRWDFVLYRFSGEPPIYVKYGNLIIALIKSGPEVFYSIWLNGWVWD